MPIKIINSEFTDTLGNVSTFYQSNTGDNATCEIDFYSNISLSTGGTYLTVDWSSNTIIWSSGGWIDEGFRVNDNVDVKIYDNTGTVVHSYSTTILYVDNVDLQLNAITHFYDATAGETFQIYVTGRNRDDLDLLFNHVQNGTTGSEFSAIDGEVTRAVFTGVDSLAVSSTLFGSLNGNLSGEFKYSTFLVRQTDVNAHTKRYKVTINFITSGLYDSNQFSNSQCLKLFVKFLWASISGEPFARAEEIVSLDANTGWFNEAHNSSATNSTLITPVSGIDYWNGNTGLTCTVDGITANICIGSAYVSQDSNYYENKTFTQSDLSMIIPTTLAQVYPTGTYNSNPNYTGAGYEIRITNIAVVGTQTTITFDFIPNATFKTLMNGNIIGNRKLYIWVKSGNINHLVFNGEMKMAEPTPNALLMTQSKFLDHSQNVTYSWSTDEEPESYSVDTEDDVSFFGAFLLEEKEKVNNLNVKLEAFNVITRDAFTLQQLNYNFANVQTGGGKYLLNETQMVNAELPLTSVKRSSILKRESALDSGTQYGVSIYYPFVCNWKYWLDFLSANVDFYPTQNQNWEQYDNPVDWIIQLKLTLTKEDSDGIVYTYTHEKQLTINPYDYITNILTEISLIRNSTGAIVSVIPEGDLLKIEGKHTHLTDNWGSDIWGMITVEPFENSPRWIASSVIDYDNDNANPLTPVSGTKISIDTSTPNVAKMLTYFDTSKIPLGNGIKITSKIKGLTTPIFSNVYSTAFDGVNQYCSTAYTSLDGMTNFSFSFWFKWTDATQGTFYWVGKNNPSSYWGGLLNIYYVNSTNTISLFLGNIAGKCVLSSSITADVWHNLTITFDGTIGTPYDARTTFYYDGAVQTTTNASNVTSFPIGTSDLMFGGRQVGTSSPTFNGGFAGKMDEISIWSKTLSLSEVAQIYNSGDEPINLSSSGISNLMNWWRMGEPSALTYPTINDEISSNNLTMVNMTSANFETDVPN